MNAAAVLKAKLRSAGVMLRREGTRLIVEAPAGVITAQLRTELAERKAELEGERVGPDENTSLTGARHEIAGLLAIAYRRHAAIQRVGAIWQEDSGDVGLANSGAPSVHGVDS